MDQTAPFYQFPVYGAVFEGAFQTFDEIAHAVEALAAVAILIRAVLYLAVAADVSRWGDLLKDSVTYFALVIAFKPTLSSFMELTEALSSQIAPHALYGIKEGLPIAPRITDGLDAVLIWMESLIPVMIFHFTRVVFTLWLSLLVSLAPVILFLALLLNLDFGIKIFIGLLVLLCLWPVTWNAVGLLGMNVWQELAGSPFSAMFVTLVVQFLQLLSPFFALGIYLWKNPVSLAHEGGVKSYVFVRQNVDRFMNRDKQNVDRITKRDLA